MTNTNSETLKKKILIDVTCLFDQYSFRGIGRYTKDLLKRMIKDMLENEKWEISLVGFNDLEQNLIAIGFSTFFIEENASKITFYSLGKPTSSTFRNILRWKEFDKVIFEAEPDLYFATHFERGLPTTLNLKHSYTKFKTVVTVHDVIPLVNNSYSKKGSIFNFIKGWFYKFMWTGVVNADLVLTSSNFSKNDLIKYGGIDESKINVIYLGINKEFYKEKIDQLPENDINKVLEHFEVKDKEYFFYDSGLESNKGIDNLIHILKFLFKEKSKTIPKYIVITGADFYDGVGQTIKARTDIGKEFLQKFKLAEILDNVITTSKVTDLELQILLAKANLYIYFSEYEGFGFGPIQAMAAEVPAIVNNASCLPEITQNGALLVNATEIEESVEAIKKYLKDKNAIEEKISIGKEVAKSYDWDKTSEATLKLFEELVN